MKTVDSYSAKEISYMVYENRVFVDKSEYLHVAQQLEEAQKLIDAIRSNITHEALNFGGSAADFGEYLYSEKVA